jgi:SAM-dependent methyltransferase
MVAEPGPGREPLSLALDVAAPRAGERILDLSGRGGAVAVGAGVATAASVEAVQPDLEHVEEGQRLARSMGLTNVFFHVGRRDRLPFDSGQFDVALLCGGLAREARPMAALREVGRVLAPSGRLVLQEVLAFGDAAIDLRVWEAERRRDAGHLLFYSREAISALVEAAGLKVENEIRTAVTQDLSYWAGVEGDQKLSTEVRDAFFALSPHLQERLDLSVADGVVSFSYPLVTLRVIPR